MRQGKRQWSYLATKVKMQSIMEYRKKDLFWEKDYGLRLWNNDIEHYSLSKRQSQAAGRSVHTVKVWREIRTTDYRLGVHLHTNDGLTPLELIKNKNKLHIKWNNSKEYPHFQIGGKKRNQRPGQRWHSRSKMESTRELKEELKEQWLSLWRHNLCFDNEEVVRRRISKQENRIDNNIPLVWIFVSPSHLYVEILTPLWR
jgi:hypothetical protein